MNERTSGLWIVALVALAGLFHVVPGTNLPAVAPGSSALSEPSVRTSTPLVIEDVAVSLLADHYLIDESAAGCSASKPNLATEIGTVTALFETNGNRVRQDTPRKGLVDSCVVKATTHKFNTDEGKLLIALVPDPVDAHATHKFDEAIEALQAGLVASGYLLDRFSLPWPRKPGAKSESAGADTHRFRSQPGVILFRKDEKKGKPPGGPLVLFLIGETPTSGVHKVALKNALQQAQRLLRNGMTEIRIIGPQFSGSVPSLITALKNWSKDVKEPVNVQVISANATRPDIRKSLDDFEEGFVTADYQATVLPDDVVQNAIFKHFDDIRVKSNEIAILRESDSAYGAGLPDVLADRQPLNSGPCKVIEPNAHPGYSIPYPMQVAQVRTRYQRELDNASKPITGGDDPVHAALHLSTDDAEDPQDKPQPYSPGTSANIAELSLATIIQTLSREHINYVGIYGTDTRDKIFLARLIHSYFPNIQFFTDDADILYTHPDYAADLWGMLVFSTYPLVSHNQTWDPHRADEIGKELHQFPSQGAESLYNATIIAVGQKFESRTERPYFMVNDRLGKNQLRLFDYRYPLHTAAEFRMPVVWTTVVGNQSLWPVGIYDPCPNQSPLKFTDGANLQRSRLFLIVFFLLSAVCVLAAGRYTHVQWKTYRKQEDVFSIFAQSRTDLSEGHVRRISILSCFVLLSLTYLFIAIVALLPPPHDILTGLTFIRFVAIFTLIVLISAVLLALTSLRGAGWSVSLCVMAVFLAAIIVVDVMYQISYFAIHQITPEYLMFYERATRLNSGVSLLLPYFFLVVAISVWLFCFLKRARLLREEGYAKNFAKASQSASVAGFYELEGKIRATMCAPFKIGWRHVVAGALGLVLFLLASWGSFFKTFESIWFDRAFRLLFSMLIGGLIWSCWDFLVISYQLRRLLRRLGFHQLTAAFDRLRRKCSRGLSTNLLDSAPSLAELQESVDQLLAIRNKFESAHPALNPLQRAALPSLPNIASLQQDLANDFRLAGGSATRWLAFRGKTQKGLADVAANILNTLCAYWEGTTFKIGSPCKFIDQGFQLCEGFVAMQIVAYLNCVFLYLRYLLICAGSALLLLLMAAGSYPFSKQKLMMDVSWALLLLFCCIYLYVFVQFDRSEVIRAIRTEQGKEPRTFNRTLLSQMILFGGIPTLMFLGSKFPSLGRLIFSWVGPVMKSVNF